MMEAGRVKHHLANNIENPRTTILCVGYCSPTTLGAKIMRGDKEVSIFGTKHKVRAQLESIESYSGHADYNELIRYLQPQKPKKVKHIFVVHGNEDSREGFMETLQQTGYASVSAPEFQSEVEI
mgnify:FL=1